jgi:hypothetical protein
MIGADGRGADEFDRRAVEQLAVDAGNGTGNQAAAIPQMFAPDRSRKASATQGMF